MEYFFSEAMRQVDINIVFHHNDVKWRTWERVMGNHAKREARQPARLTVTLAPGQRDALQEIAGRNHATLAYVVRYAITEFIESHKNGQLPLAFPVISASNTPTST